MSRDRREAVGRVLELCVRLAPALAATAALGLGLYFRPAMFTASGALFVAGVVSFCGLLLSWRYYRGGVSMPLASIFMAFSFSVPMLVLVLPAVRAGALHPLGALFAMVGWFGLGVTAPVSLFRSRLRQWLLG